ncbi:MAG TPA: PEPxxWA-CTERM sorting domain-containing protein [Caulobacteraceae bacterium]|nr:PEPxxWA-CTERM sorting domain-containing protein [Caulobacteraceae bacterium]
MNWAGRIATVCATALMGLVCVGSAQALTVPVGFVPIDLGIQNVSAANNTGITLPAGSYEIDFVGVAQGGLYDAWNPWGIVSGCDVNGAHCSNGWVNYLSFQPAAGANIITWSATNGPFDTALNALNNMQSGPISTFLNGSFVGSHASPLITLAGSPQVHLFIDDTVYSDNVGGVSFHLYQFVPAPAPEPSAWALMITGFGMVGVGMRLRRRKLA